MADKILYQQLCKFKLTPNQLIKHGFPQESGIPGRAVINDPFAPKNLPSTKRLCDHCRNTYDVDGDGRPLEKKQCSYHALKKENWSIDRHPCCGGRSVNGCVTGDSHVARCVNEDTMLTIPSKSRCCFSKQPCRNGGFKRIPAKTSEDSDDKTYGVYALDCEMIFTTEGLELARVAILDMDCNVIYQNLVKPDNIVDYNTCFTGITKDMMDGTSTTIQDVQEKIMDLCNSDTILIGHSLDADMAALKLFHNSVVDTSAMYPHRRALPIKKGLRTLAKELLGRNIQQSSGGHDCVEDARTCVQLVKYKLNR